MRARKRPDLHEHAGIRDQRLDLGTRLARRSQDGHTSGWHAAQPEPSTPTGRTGQPPHVVEHERQPAHARDGLEHLEDGQVNGQRLESTLRRIGAQHDNVEGPARRCRQGRRGIAQRVTNQVVQPDIG